MQLVHQNKEGPSDSCWARPQPGPPRNKDLLVNPTASEALDLNETRTDGVGRSRHLESTAPDDVMDVLCGPGLVTLPLGAHEKGAGGWYNSLHVTTWMERGLFRLQNFKR